MSGPLRTASRRWASLKLRTRYTYSLELQMPDPRRTLHRPLKGTGKTAAANALLRICGLLGRSLRWLRLFVSPASRLNNWQVVCTRVRKEKRRRLSA
jgi:hypothetical protein